MAHIHSVYDSDSHFKIDPITRMITNMSSQKVTLVQYDHNSERFTFELPRYVEFHDMSTCNLVQVHYSNGENMDVYLVEDLQISPASEDVVTCSWLISQNATQFVGSLNFLVRFVCTTNGVIDYAWNTAIFSGINVSTGLDNSSTVAEDYSDILLQWKAEIDEKLAEVGTGGVSETEVDEKVSKVKKELIGYEDDKTDDDTVNGAKAYARWSVSNLERSIVKDYATKKELEQEIATFDFIKVVTELPETGFENRLYLVPKQDPQTQDLFDEYAWVNRGTEEVPDWGWEYLSTKQFEIDLTNYATKNFVEFQMENLVGEETDDEEARTIEGTRKYAESLLDYKIHEQNYLSMEIVPNDIPFGTHICDVSNVENLSPDGSWSGVFTSTKLSTAMMAEQTFKSFDSGEKYERCAESSQSWGKWKKVVTMDDVNDAKDHAKTLLELLYDVGSIYLNFNYVNPAVVFGFGEWELIENRFLLGAGDKYAEGQTGGEATHTLIAAELPKQTGTIVTHGTYSGTPIADVSGVFTKEHVVESKYLSGSQGTSANSVDVIGYSNGGAGKAHNNMPPFIAVYMWRRIA